MLKVSHTIFIGTTTHVRNEADVQKGLHEVEVTVIIFMSVKRLNWNSFKKIM